MLAFLFNIFFLLFLLFLSFSVNIFLFLESRVRVRETRSCCHTLVTSDDTVTSHEVTEKDVKDSG